MRHCSMFSQKRHSKKNLWKVRFTGRSTTSTPQTMIKHNLVSVVRRRALDERTQQQSGHGVDDATPYHGLPNCVAQAPGRPAPSSQSCTRHAPLIDQRPLCPQPRSSRVVRTTTGRPFNNNNVNC